MTFIYSQSFNVLFILRSWQEEKHLFLFLYLTQQGKEMKANGNAYGNTIETRRTRRKRRRHAKGMHKDTYGGEKTKQREHYYLILET